MNTYHVHWPPAAEDQLAEIWLQASDQAAVTTAQAQIDSELARDPYRKGKHVTEGLWRVIVPPLVAFFEIDEDKKKVEVTGVARLR